MGCHGDSFLVLSTYRPWLHADVRARWSLVSRVQASPTCLPPRALEIVSPFSSLRAFLGGCITFSFLYELDTLYPSRLKVLCSLPLLLEACAFSFWVPSKVCRFYCACSGSPICLVFSCLPGSSVPPTAVRTRRLGTAVVSSVL